MKEVNQLLATSRNNGTISRMKFVYTAACISAISAANVFAAEGDTMPWVEPVCKLAGSLSGPVVTGVAVIAIVVAGLMFAMDEVSSMFKKVGGIIVGLGIAMGSLKFIAFFNGNFATLCNKYTTIGA